MPDRQRLIIPPYVGEFGWELMNWQARVRSIVHQSSTADITLAIAPGHEPLYTDLTSNAHVRSVSASIAEVPGQPNEDHRIDAHGSRIDSDATKHSVVAAMAQSGVDLTDASILWPDYRGTLFPTEPPHQIFVPLGGSRPPSIDVLLVPRSRASADKRNQSQDWWNALAAQLRGCGLSVDTYSPPLENAIAQLKAARLAAGGSTGGLHLASLCGCPHVVWGPGRAERWTNIQMTNRQRYETIWNPLGTRVQYHELGWRPSIDQAASAIICGFNSIAIGISPPATIPLDRFRWRARRGLAGLWARSASEGRTPWRVRKLLREATS
jgi:hypothetical protein